MKTFITLAFLALSPLCVMAADKPSDMPCPPKDIIDVVERKAACEHWGGEEPYDDARGKQIAGAMEKLNCDSLNEEAGKLHAKYNGDAKTQNMIGNFDDVIAAYPIANEQWGATMKVYCTTK